MVATALREWIPNTLQAVSPWMSDYDIHAGARWSSEMSLQLSKSRFGIICLTPENLEAPWVMFEAGVLSKEMEYAYVVPYLFGFESSDLTGPLAQFQAVRANKDDTKKVIQVMNKALGESALPDTRLSVVFEKWWPDLAAKLSAIGSSPVTSRPARAKKNRDKSPDVNLLQSRIKKLEHTLKVLLPTLSPSDAAQTKPDRSQYVFLVYGHNEVVRETVARFIEQIGAIPIFLQEKPDKGHTIIEKLQEFSEVGYAVVLLTGDDIGRSVKDPTVRYPRARQNVIFELGYLLAKLGRDRIRILMEEGVEILSDLYGLIYIPLDSRGTWKLVMAKELRSAGVKINLDNLL